MEKNRVWHDPVVEIFGNLITPGVRCAAEAYDLGNRRWYQFNIDAVVTDDEWMSEVVAKHVRAYYQEYQTPPSWNSINLTFTTHNATFEIKPDSRVARPIKEKLTYETSPTDKLLTIKFDEVKEKTYLSRAADYCVWNGKKCVFKRIEFDVDIRSFGREIRKRESLISYMKGEMSAEDHEKEMWRRFNIVPILAVVQHGNWHPEQESNSVIGFLMPFIGDSLEVITERHPASQLPITRYHLWNLARGVRELGLCGIMHGDICFWNVILQQKTSTFDPNSAYAQTRLLLIDLGDIAPDYEGDVKALGSLFSWCLEHASTLGSEPNIRQSVEAAVKALKEDEDLDHAIGLLSPGTVELQSHS